MSRDNWTFDAQIVTTVGMFIVTLGILFIPTLTYLDREDQEFRNEIRTELTAIRFDPTARGPLGLNLVHSLKMFRVFNNFREKPVEMLVHLVVVRHELLLGPGKGIFSPYSYRHPPEYDA